jgi:hypothetical protein
VADKPKAVDIFLALLMRNVVFGDNKVDTADARRAAVLSSLRRGEYTVTKPRLRAFLAVAPRRPPGDRQGPETRVPQRRVLDTAEDRS